MGLVLGSTDSEAHLPVLASVTLFIQNGFLFVWATTPQLGDLNPFFSYFLRGLRSSLDFIFECFLKTRTFEWNALDHLWPLLIFSHSDNDEDSLLMSHAVTSLCSLSRSIVESCL